MVKFSVFNELSLPFASKNEIYSKFEIFFQILKKLNSIGLTIIRIDKDFKNYEVLKNITFQQFFGQIQDKEFKRKMRSFISNKILEIDSPLIKDNDIQEKEKSLENEYFYKDKSTIGGLACADIWNTIAISFNSNIQWDNSNIILQKQNINNIEENIDIKHSSKIAHLNFHQYFFDELEKEKKLNITQSNFWDKRKEFFPNKIIFSKEIEKQIKNLSNNNRIYFLERNQQIYIGYIGKHLTNKNDKG